MIEIMVWKILIPPALFRFSIAKKDMKLLMTAMTNANEIAFIVRTTTIDGKNMMNLLHGCVSSFF
jgi:hypothetical protein